MKQRDNYVTNKQDDQCHQKHYQGDPVHAVHIFNIGIIRRFRVAFPDKKIFLYLSPDSHNGYFQR